MTETQCLVIGSGIAGLSAAAYLGERGVATVVITAARQTTDSNSWLAQGGIVYQSATANEPSLIADILNAGGGDSFRPAVEQLARRGPALVRELLVEKAGVPFEREGGGGFALTREGAHSEDRILYRGDQTGRSIEEALTAYVKTLPSVRLVTQATAANLLMSSFHPLSSSVRQEGARCFGAFVFDHNTRKTTPIFAQHTVLATGGVGQLFLHSTNSGFARGDGIALAHRAGCRLRHLEFVQFHPTTFYHERARRFLISEALRGEGGKLVNAKGERFLSKYLEGDTPELASRDRVAWAINQEMVATGSPCVYLDISHRPKVWLEERFPYVYRSCLEHGIDISQEPIPVVPGAHYHVGGVWTDLSGRTSVPHLWAAGEVACTGLHGFNRLASTSLLEGLVWGTAAAESLVRELEVEGSRPFPEIAPWESGTEPVEGSFLKQDWNTLKTTMWNYVGLIKSDARLRRAEGILWELKEGIERFYRGAQLSDELIGLRHGSLAATLIVKACQRNRRTQGCYLREDEA